MVDLIENILEKAICRDCGDCLLHSLIPQERFCFKYGVAREDTEEAIEEWLSSFDTNSATKCFEAVNLLKQRLEGENDEDISDSH